MIYEEMPQNIGKPYQMEDNKATPSAAPQGGGASRRPLGFVVLHLVRISYVFATFPEPVLARSNFQHAAFLGNAHFKQKKALRNQGNAHFSQKKT